MTTIHPAASAARATGTILVVEDNRDLCENLAEILEGAGYAVATALTARQALDRLSAATPDVALIDLNLPDGRGLDIVAEMRRSAPQSAAVILTGNASLESAVEAVNHGAYAYVLKGGRIEEIISTVGRAAEKVRLEREKERLQREVVQATRLAAIGEMAARVAHEIRNPLAGIAGAIRVLTRGGSENDPKREAFAKELIALIGRLNAFVEDLLLYARPLRIARSETMFAKILEPLRAVLREHPVVRGVVLEVEDRLGRPLFVDPHFFAMALQNLILNAGQALKGKGRVRLEAAPGEAGGAVVSVSDDGPGIPKDILPHIFDAFATTRIEGTGLGLSTTKRIVEAHGGTIAASNSPGGGARFEIRLPAFPVMPTQAR